MAAEDVLAFTGAQVVAEGVDEPIEFIGQGWGQLRALGRFGQSLGQILEWRHRQQEGREVAFRLLAFAQRLQAIEPPSLFALHAGEHAVALLEADGAGIGKEVVGVHRVLRSMTQRLIGPWQRNLEGRCAS